MLALVVSFLHQHSIVIQTLTDIFTSIGTVGAVIVALWLGYKDNVPRLNVRATVSVLYPDERSYLSLSCINTSKQPILCTNFAFNTNKIIPKNSMNIMFRSTHEVKFTSTKNLPYYLPYSHSLEQYFDLSVLEDESMLNLISSKKWIAELQLKYLWQILMGTNIKSFGGNLSPILIEYILSIKFKSDKL